jgi:EamA domain-containing membrane protein RarD
MGFLTKRHWHACWALLADHSDTGLFDGALAYFLLKERSTTWQIVGGCVAVVGVGVIAIWKVQGAEFVSFMLVLGAALAWAVANIITKRAGRINKVSFIVWASLVAPLPLFALSLLTEGPDAVVSALMHPTRMPSWSIEPATIDLSTSIAAIGARRHLMRASMLVRSALASVSVIAAPRASVPMR